MGCRCTSTAAIVRLRIFVLIINTHPAVIGDLHFGTDGPVCMEHGQRLGGLAHASLEGVLNVVGGSM